LLRPQRPKCKSRRIQLALLEIKTTGWAGKWRIRRNIKAARFDFLAIFYSASMIMTAVFVHAHRVITSPKTIPVRPEIILIREDPFHKQAHWSSMIIGHSPHSPTLLFASSELHNIRGHTQRPGKGTTPRLQTNDYIAHFSPILSEDFSQHHILL